MALTKEKTASVVTNFGANEKDTGNTKVQTEHYKTFKKDTGSSRALIKLVGQRRRLLKYLQRTGLETYRELIKELGLRK